MRFSGKKVLVTGAGRGIGSAASLLFAAEGATVIAVDVDSDRAGEIVAQIGSQGGKGIACQLDVANSKQVESTVDRLVGEFGAIDVLYNNAAVTSFGTVLHTTDEELDRVLTTNVKSMFYICRAVLPGMIAHGAGVIICNASITGIVGAPGMAAYATTKGAILAFTKTLALEVAEQNIRVNCICPASVDTPMLQASFARTEDPMAVRERNIKRHPLGRLGTPEDVAKLALFLASDEASFITGSVYTVDGGALNARRWME